jgi:two-component system cell cycle sensor histidine kinase/response regulator CckA
MHVLIVDDEPVNREVLRAVLEPGGHSVTETVDGMEALEALEREPVDAVISDIQMPRMDGYRLCLELRKKDKFNGLPFILYSSTYKSPSDEQAALDLGADKFLRRPAPAKQIIEALEEARAGASQRRPKAGQELELMKEYSERLVAKLEKKNHELEARTESLQKSESYLRSILESALDGIVRINPEGQITGWNPAAEKTFGAGSDAVMGKSMAESLIAPTARDQFRSELNRAFQMGESLRLELPALRKTGKEFPVELMISRVAGSMPPIFTVLLRDLTERKELEELLRQSQKMEAVGRLAGGVAHDFNNLLAVIRANIELVLMDGSQLGKRGGECLKQAAAATDRAANLTRQLLAFGRKQVLKPQPLNLNEVIANLNKMLQRLIREDIELRSDCAAGLPFVQADAGMLEQVLVNLIVNARDAMPSGGKLLITTETVHLDAAYAQLHPEARPGEFVALSVRDNGSGIAPEHLPRIFEPFFTTKEIGKGTGLGLATVYGIVKQHQGWVEVTSQVGTGTTFRVLLPTINAPVPAPAEARTDSGLRGGTETILLVEDEETVRVAMRRLLERFGYRISEAASGPEALQKWRANEGSFDLLLTDVVMPNGVNGRELAEGLRTERPGLKVIFMSGYNGEALGKDTTYLRRTKSRLVQKPCSCQDLVQVVRQCLDEK